VSWLYVAREGVFAALLLMAAAPGEPVLRRRLGGAADVPEDGDAVSKASSTRVTATVACRAAECSDMPECGI
jgi:hypothetical protein